MKNEVMHMVHTGSQTVNELMENLWSAAPYVGLSVLIAIFAKYGIEEGWKHFKKVYGDDAHIGEDNI